MFEVAMPAAGGFEELREPLGRREAASARLVVLAFQVLFRLGVQGTA